MATPQHKKLCTGGHETYNLCRPVLGHHYYILNLTEPCPGIEKKSF